MSSAKSCVVCGPADETVCCASGHRFCTTHATCSKCRTILSNGELQAALIAMDNPAADIEHIKKHLKGDKRYRLMVRDAINRALEKLRLGARLAHAGKSACCQCVPRTSAPGFCNPSELSLERRQRFPSL